MIQKDGVAAQNRPRGEKAAPKGPSPVIEAICRMAKVDRETAETMASRMPPHIRAMLENMPPAMIEMAARSMGADMMKEMMDKAMKQDK